MLGQIQETKNILFIDDEASVVNSLKLVFRRVKSLHIYTTTDQQEALSMVEKKHFHVVISDMKMPGMNGAELLSEVKKKSPNSLRILLTGYSEMDNVLNSINQGEVYRFLEKPWNNKNIKQTILKAADISVNLWKSQQLELESNLNPQQHQKSNENKKKTAQHGILFIGKPNTSLYSLLNEKINANIYQAPNAAKAALMLLKHTEISTIVAYADSNYRQLNRYSHFSDITSLLKTLKSICPMLIAIVISDEKDSRTAIGLINEAQVFRYLSLPINHEDVVQDTRDALNYAHLIKIDPQLAERHNVEEMNAKEKEEIQKKIDFSLFDKLKTRFNQFFLAFKLKTGRDRLTRQHKNN